MASLLVAVIFSLLTLLKAHLTVLRLLFDFSRREQDILKLLSLPALGGTMIIKSFMFMFWSKPAKTKRSGTTFKISCEQSNGGRMEGE